MKEMNTKIQIIILLLVLISCGQFKKATAVNAENKNNDTVIVKMGIVNNQISADLQDALKRRMSKHQFDSLSKQTRAISKEENEWKELIESKSTSWNQLKDSLKVPFPKVYINDTTYIILSYRGWDDAFTIGYQTICFDLTALQRVYGSAKKPVNKNRIDRFFAHEYTHLLHNEWARQNELTLTTFKDSILWECIFEGIGMYRSMSARWFPVGDSLSEVSKSTFKVLYPTFTDRLIAIDTTQALSDTDKKNLHANLSRGSMKTKWGALPVAVWLALEAKGNDKNLIPWVNKGPDAVIPLAKKYLIGESKQRFDKAFGDIYYSPRLN